MKHDIFLSYRRTDQKLAEAIVSALESRGVKVWWDQKIGGGEDWRDAIVDNLTRSSVLMILFSEACNESKQLRKELAIADHMNKEIIPVLIEEAEPRGHYLYELASRNWIQIFPNPEQKIDRLVQKVMPMVGAAVEQDKNDAILSPATELPTSGVSKTATEAAIGKKSETKKDKKKTGSQPKKQRDFLPYKWFDIIFIGAGLAFIYSTVVQGNSSGSVITDFGAPLCFAAAVWGTIAFPIRYFLRNRSPFRALSMLFVSTLIPMTLCYGLCFIAWGNDSDGLLFMTVAFGALFVTSSIIYAVLASIRARRRLKKNTTKL